MTKILISYRRIDQLKTIAFTCGFTNEDAKQFGKLSKTATWEALLETQGIPSQAVDRDIDNNLQSLDTSGWTNDDSWTVYDCGANSSFLDWVDLSQLIALALASAGVFVLVMSMWQQINPLNLFPRVDRGQTKLQSLLSQFEESE
ncbi:hypothetical protein Q5692_37220 [Microcoleus sp. C2C3]|uniref:hypothetical protein n=1 Tax=unclassified Microcoleus TaxID=2642155 RepID=UPI002FCF3BBE